MHARPPLGRNPILEPLQALCESAVLFWKGSGIPCDIMREAKHCSAVAENIDWATCLAEYNAGVYSSPDHHPGCPSCRLIAFERLVARAFFRLQTDGGINSDWPISGGNHSHLLKPSLLVAGGWNVGKKKVK
jgi:hypothetical protein